MTRYRTTVRYPRPVNYRAGTEMSVILMGEERHGVVVRCWQEPHATFGVVGCVRVELDDVPADIARVARLEPVEGLVDDETPVDAVALERAADALSEADAA